MPREDERYRNLSPKHPVYCTCVDCVAARNDSGGGPAGVVGKLGGLVGKVAGKGKGSVQARGGRSQGSGKKRGPSGASGKSRGRSQNVGEPVRKHKANCECATCTLLKSI